MTVIKLFTPDPLPCDLGRRLNSVEHYFGGRAVFESTRGRWALKHILKNAGVSGTVLFPAYLCGSVLKATEQLPINCGFFDIDRGDCNPSINSLQEQIAHQHPVAVVFPSLYGNPADLIAAEVVCHENNVMLIDDAAQATGASLNGRYVGSFGDAGFIACSPGKPMPGAMGAYWWSSALLGAPFFDDPTCWKHRLIWASWEACRLNAYSFDVRRILGLIKIVEKIVTRLTDMSSERLCELDRRNIAGYLAAILEGVFAYRREAFLKLSAVMSSNCQWQIVTAKRGYPHNYKFVLIAPSRADAMRFIKYMAKHGIVVNSGYKLLYSNPEVVPVAVELEGRIVELPIEHNLGRMDYLQDTVGRFLVVGLC